MKFTTWAVKQGLALVNVTRTAGSLQTRNKILYCRSTAQTFGIVPVGDKPQSMYDEYKGKGAYESVQLLIFVSACVSQPERQLEVVDYEVAPSEKGNAYRENKEEDPIITATHHKVTRLGIWK